MTKQKIAVAGLMQLIKLLVSSGVLKDIQSLIRDYWLEDLSGEDKKQRVMVDVKALKNDTGVAVKGMAGWLLSTTVDIVHAYMAVNTK